MLNLGLLKLCKHVVTVKKNEETKEKDTTHNISDLPVLRVASTLFFHYIYKFRALSYNFTYFFESSGRDQDGRLVTIDATVFFF